MRGVKTGQFVPALTQERRELREEQELSIHVRMHQAYLLLKFWRLNL